MPRTRWGLADADPYAGYSDKRARELEELRAADRERDRARRAGRKVLDVGQPFSSQVDFLLSLPELMSETDTDLIAYLAQKYVAFERSEQRSDVHVSYWVNREVDAPVRLCRTVAKVNREARKLHSP